MIVASCSERATSMAAVMDEITTSSVIEFLNQEKNCMKMAGCGKVDADTEDNSEVDIESIFDEINRLSVRIGDEKRGVEEIIREAENLILNQEPIMLKCTEVVNEPRLCSDVHSEAAANGTTCSVHPEREEVKSVPKEATSREIESLALEYLSTNKHKVINNMLKVCLMQ